MLQWNQGPFQFLHQQDCRRHLYLWPAPGSLLLQEYLWENNSTLFCLSIPIILISLYNSNNCNSFHNKHILLFWSNLRFFFNFSDPFHHDNINKPIPKLKMNISTGVNKTFLRNLFLEHILDVLGRFIQLQVPKVTNQDPLMYPTCQLKPPGRAILFLQKGAHRHVSLPHPIIQNLRI